MLAGVFHAFKTVICFLITVGYSAVQTTFTNYPNFTSATGALLFYVLKGVA
ncbi:hypothetical protein BACINT_04879 [Bacteroides intestinalis DSM 17393]|uniref:Uncharacterized protein n=1 Tax=Bacteroides intestinalis DSM 17393 TaxID=471870 RepID=B3CIH4_9BACE|nr:hypothetical protein BACINT_04879 [Bacteroides intestinalis DSM 17393]